MKSQTIVNIVIVVASLILSYFLAYFFGLAYRSLFPEEFIGGWIGSTESINFIRGFSLSLIFFLSLAFRGVLVKFKWSILFFIIVLLPLFIWEIYIDFAHIFVSIILGLLGWGLGVIIQKIISRNPLIRNNANKI